MFSTAHNQQRINISENTLIIDKSHGLLCFSTFDPELKRIVLDFWFLFNAYFSVIKSDSYSSSGHIKCTKTGVRLGLFNY